MSADRDLAEAIHHELISPESVSAALVLWLQHRELDEHSRMWRVLARTSSNAIEAVLTRRQRETARAGPWEGTPLAGTNPGDTPAHTVGQWGDYQEEDGYPGSLLPLKRGTP